MSRPKTDHTETYTYKDYMNWDDSERWELINGIPYMMASPTPEHQQIALQMSTEFNLYFRKHKCQAFIAPLDVIFEDNENVNTVVQPDLFVMCDEFGHTTRITGIPMLIVEILSPSTIKHDLVRKLNLYQKVGVKEYWIIDPAEQNITVYLHDGAVFQLVEQEFKKGDQLSSSVFPDLLIDVEVIFS